MITVEYKTYSMLESEQDWKSDRSAKLKSGSKIHESMNAGFELNN